LAVTALMKFIAIAAWAYPSSIRLASGVLAAKLGSSELTMSPR
jgi:hypothetical protein